LRLLVDTPHHSAKHQLILNRPILTYSGQATAKHGVHTTHHSIIYPSNTSREEKKKGVGVLKDAIKIQAEKFHRLDTASRVNYAQTYTIEHIVKVIFTGRMDETNMERLLSRNPAWECSDTGEDIPVIMEDQPYPSFSCCRRRFQLLERHAMSNKMIALFGLSSGLLMSSGFVWLNKRMELYEPSLIMNKVTQALLARIMLTIVDCKR
jgi:hypothetical protein